MSFFGTFFFILFFFSGIFWQRMARIPRFTVGKVERRGATLWRIVIPARFSANGRQRHVYYKTRAQAEQDARMLRERYASGTLGLSEILPPAVVRDAQAALAVLRSAGLNMGLADAARLAAEHASAMQRGITIAALLERYAAEAGAARGWKEDTRKTWRKYAGKLEAAFGGMNCADLKPDALREWMRETFPTPTGFNGFYRTLAGCFSWAVKMQLLAVSPFRFIERVAQKRKGVDIFSPKEARAIMAACRDLRTDPRQVWRDCSDCAVPFALLLFAGIRPKELERLTWEDIREQPDGREMIFVGDGKAKTSTSRFVRVRPNLAAFLAAWRGRRHGSIVPANWGRKCGLVRRLAGVSGRQDTARHSFASYALAAGEPLEQVRSDMGHAHGSAMIFTNYRAAATPATAREYWAIMP